MICFLFCLNNFCASDGEFQFLFTTVNNKNTIAVKKWGSRSPLAPGLLRSYFDKLDDIVNEYSNTYHRTIKMKSVDVKSNTYIDSSKEINNKDPKFKIGDIVRISSYNNIFTKGYTPNWSEEVFVIKKVKNTAP